MTQTESIHTVREKLPRWYTRHSRNLPWRKSRDPYAVWVSEIMLQQTRVDQASPYFERFMKKFPTVFKLAAADQEEVLKAWEGMGYYTRARNLHAAAKRVVDEYNGRLPDTAEELAKLPGIGRYTAGAIASIAFGLDEPVLDGNVARVLTRVFAIADDPKEVKTQKRLWSLARKMIPRGRAGDFNQALMDLGATICTPRKPDCASCPLSGICLANRRGKQERFPFKRPKKPVPHRTIVAGVIGKSGKVLIDQRKPEGLLGGLWEFPGGKKEKGETLKQAVAREIREEVGIEVSVGRRMTLVNHAYSHFKITLHVFECSHESGRARAIGCKAVKWVRPEELGRYAFPAANHKILKLLREVNR